MQESAQPNDAHSHNRNEKHDKIFQIKHFFLRNLDKLFIVIEGFSALANALGKNCVPVLGDKTPTLRSR